MENRNRQKWCQLLQDDRIKEQKVLPLENYFLIGDFFVTLFDHPFVVQCCLFTHLAKERLIVADSGETVIKYRETFEKISWLILRHRVLFHFIVVMEPVLDERPDLHKNVNPLKENLWKFQNNFNKNTQKQFFTEQNACGKLQYFSE